MKNAEYFFGVRLDISGKNYENVIIKDKTLPPEHFIYTDKNNCITPLLYYRLSKILSRENNYIAIWNYLKRIS